MNKQRGKFRLLQALRSQIRKDIYEERAILFETVLKYSPIAAFFLRTINRSIFLRTLCCAAYGLAKSRIGKLPRAHLALIGIPAEKKLFERLTEIAPHLGLGCAQHQSTVSGLLNSVAHAQYVFRFWRPLLQLNKRYPLYVAMRASEIIFVYSSLSKKWRASPPRSLTIFSEGNPRALAGWAAAKSHSIPTIFVAHSPMITNPTKFDLDLAILYGKESELAFKSAGASFSRCIHFGWMRAQRSGSDKKKICVSLSKDVSLPFLERTLKAINARYADPIVVRAHPNSLVPRRAIRAVLRHGETLSRCALEDDLSEARMHIAGNSSVHIESLARGIPSFYIADLDGTGNFPIEFIQKKLVPQITLDQLESGNLTQKILDDSDSYISSASRASFKAELEEFFSRL